MGITLTHEHLSLDFQPFYNAPPEHLKSYFDDREKIKLENVGMIKQYPYGSRFNITFNDEVSLSRILEDVALFKKWGGGSIVENSSHGLQRDLGYYCELAEKTGVNIIAGTGHYIGSCQSASALSLSLEQLSDLYSKEIVTGVDLKGDGKTIVKCGVIGEVGSNWPLNGS